MCASGPTRLSNTTPARLIQSTGNLYWSSDQGTSSAIFRASKSGQPGEEVQLYAEGGATGGFGALTFAEVGGEFYGYFVANYNDVSQIKRIPLAGGPAVVLADSPATIIAPSVPGPDGDLGADGDLVTDGSFLCWADSEGIRSMPIGGGPVTTLVAGTGFARLAVLDGTLYYTLFTPTSPTAGNAILSIPTRGGTPSNVVGNQPSPITALYVMEAQPQARPPVARAERPQTPGPPPPPRPDTAVVWGRNDGGVFGMFLGTTTYQEPGEQQTVASVYSTATRVLWSTGDLAAFPPGEPPVGHGPSVQPPVLSMSYGGVTTTLSSETSSESTFAFFFRDVLADDVAAYWTDTYVEKYTF